MIVIINQECEQAPKDSAELPVAGTALLNMLLALGYPINNPPLGSLLAKYHNLQGNWAIVSPVHWRASHNDAVLLAEGSSLELTKAESKNSFALIQKHLALDGMDMFYYSADIWLLNCDNKPELLAKPVHQILNKSLMPELAELDKTMYWQRFITETQMLFATLPNNSVLNGVWVWGNAKLDLAKTPVLYANESFINLALLADANSKIYSPDSLLKECKIIMLSDINELSTAHQLELKNSPVNWYWTNCAYSQLPINWITRLWRTLFHAN
jgi:hypothetical protein